MDSSRDSSVWRSLAVTFGGGLALGAVGMKLTQTALRPVEVTPRPETDSLAGRLDSMERRQERMAETPVSARPSAAGQTAAATIDQKVLEAVVGAVDARLQEHASKMDRRLADLEARFAVEAQALHRQDSHAAEGNEKRLAEIERQFRHETAALRTAFEQEFGQLGASVSQTVAGEAATQAEVRALHQQNERIVDAAEQRFADVRDEHRREVADLRETVSQAIAGQAAAHERKAAELRAAMEEAVASHVAARAAALERSLEARIITAAAAAAAAQFEERLVPLRAEVGRKEQELAELRQRLAESERSMLDVVTAIGQVCREAADRMNSGGGSRPTAPPTEPAVPATGSAAIGPSAAEPTPPPAPQSTAEMLLAGELAANPLPAAAAPDFLHEVNRRDSWRIPLVSSFLVASGAACLLAMHYL